MSVEEESPDHSSGCMIALYPPAQLATTLAVPNGLPAADMHVTIAFVGDAVDIDVEALMVAAKAVTDRAPIDAQISGHARFTGGDKGDVIVALIDSASLEQLRRDLVDALTAQGITIPHEHGYTSHLSITYIGEEAEAPFERLATTPVTFTSLSVVHGENRTDLRFTGTTPDDSAMEAREAYAQGWARTGGPMTERVQAGCVAAMGMARDHSHHPHVTEVALQLGSLEGVWAWVYQRREDLIAAHIGKIALLWRDIVARLDPKPMLTRLRQLEGLAETSPERVQQVAQAATAVHGWLAQIRDADQYRTLVDTVADALHAAAAEGRAAALAVAAEQRPMEKLVHIGDMWFDFDLAFDHAYQALDNQAWPASDWIDKVLKGGASDAGHLLADLIANETPYDEMAGALEDLLGQNRALGLFMDMAMSAALNQGAVDLYASEGVQSYDVLSAGDQRVCSRCLQAEANNPHPVTEPSPISLHPGCRCSVAPTEPLNPASYQRYLPAEGGD